MRTHKSWTPAEDDIIRANWHSMTDAQLAALLPNRTVMAIGQRRAIDLHLSRKKRAVNAFAYDELPLSGEYGPRKKTAPIYRGKVPDNPISPEFIKGIDLMKKVHGTYGGAR